MTHINQFRLSVDKYANKLLERWPNSQRVKTFVDKVIRDHKNKSLHEVLSERGRTANDPVCECHDCDCQYCDRDELCEFHNATRGLVGACEKLEIAEKEELARIKQEASLLPGELLKI